MWRWRRRTDEDFREEIQANIALDIDRLISEGFSPEEARAQALRAFGNVARVQERFYESTRMMWLDDLRRDARYACRMLLKSPGFTAAIVVTLALGIGVNTAIFQLLDAVRLRSLPVQHPEQLVEIHAADLTRGRMGTFSGRRPVLTHPLWEQLRAHQQPFSALFAWSAAPFNIGSGGHARYVQGLWISGDFFSVLGLQPVKGRLFTQADDRVGCGLTGVVISFAFWQSEYGGDARAIGERLPINNRPFEVIGITPAGFDGVEIGRTFDVAAPICAQPAAEPDDSMLNDRGRWWLAVMGRLRPGWSVEQASADLESISGPMFKDTLPGTFLPDVARAYLATKLRAFPAGTGVSSGLREEYGTPLWLLLGITGLVLVIACANVGNLLLVRSTVRERETAVRLALGASRGRIVRALLVESLMMAVGGTALGAGLAVLLSRGVVSLLRSDDFQFMGISLNLFPNWHVFGFAASLAAVTCLLFGLAPARRAMRTSPEVIMKASSRGVVGRSERFGIRRVLVIVQVALSLVLIIGAVLFVRTLGNLGTQDAGFRMSNLVWASIDCQQANVPVDRRVTLRQQMVEQMRAIPGVESAASVRQVPLGGESSLGPIVVNGIGQQTQSYFSRVGVGYFETMGTTLVAGRDFSVRDSLAAPRVAIVNQTFVRLYLSQGNPVGLRFALRASAGEAEPLYEIIGLVPDSKYNDLREPFLPIAFFPDAQTERPGANFNVLIRSRLPLAALTASLTNAVSTVNPAAVVYTRTFQSVIQGSLTRERLMAALSGFFGLLAGLLAVIGLYGVLSYTVTRRTNEIGVRMALGAGHHAVMQMILTEAAMLLSMGILVGSAVAFATSGAIRALLYGLQPNDPLTFALCVVGLGSVALLAAAVPARRAARIDPAVALRCD